MARSLEILVPPSTLDGSQSRAVFSAADGGRESGEPNVRWNQIEGWLLRLERLRGAAQAGAWQTAPADAPQARAGES